MKTLNLSKFLTALTVILLMSSVAKGTTFYVTSLSGYAGSWQKAMDDSRTDLTATANDPHIIEFCVSGTISTSEYPQNWVVVNGPEDMSVILDGTMYMSSSNLTGKEITFNNITFANGSTSSFGGSMMLGVNAVVNLNKCRFTNNTANSHGGAIFMNGGEMHFNACSFDNNTTTDPNGWGGGAFFSNHRPATFTNCTFYNNSTASTQSGSGGGGGGAIYGNNGSDITVTNCTFYKNTSALTGGAIHKREPETSTLKINNSIFVDNTAPSSGDLFGPMTSTMGHNIIMDSAGVNLLGVTTGNMYNVASATSVINNFYGDWGNYIPTLGVAWNSPAIDAADSTGAPALDQRGYERGGAGPDIGALDYDYTNPCSGYSVTVNGPESCLQTTADLSASISGGSLTNSISWMEESATSGVCGDTMYDAPYGTYVVRVTDTAGCFTKSTFTFEADTVPPVINYCYDQNVYLDSFGAGTLVPGNVFVSLDDNCNIDDSVDVWANAGSYYCSDLRYGANSGLTYQGVFAGTFTSSGSDTGQFNGPYGITYDASGNIYVADKGNNRIQKFNASGVFLMEFGTAGSGNGQFNNPNDVAIDASGNIYVADQNNDRIQKFDASGNYLSQFGTTGSALGQLSGPFAIDIDGSGNIYVVETGNSRVQKFSSTGTALLTFGSNGTGDGQFSLPYDIAISSDDRIYVVDYSNHRIQEFDVSGNFVGKFGEYGTSPGELFYPTTVTVDLDGNIYVNAQSMGYLQKFSSSYNYLQHVSASSVNGIVYNPVTELIYGATNWSHVVQYELGVAYPQTYVYVEDESGNRDSCLANVRVTDNIAPAITNPGTQYTCGNIVPDFAYLVNDNCDGDPTIVQTPAAGSTFSGSVSLQIEATDSSGNTSNRNFLLIEAAPVVANVTINGCDSAMVNGTMYYTTQTINDTLSGMASNGCDSIVITDLTINTTKYGTQDVTSCDSANIHGNWYFTTQTVIDTLAGAAASGCDSIVTTNLTINNSVTFNQTVMACDSANINGSWYFTSQVVTDVLSGSASNGCDSIVVTDLVINQTKYHTENETACDSANVRGTWYFSTQTIVDTLSGAAVSGCDSVVTTNLTIHSSQVFTQTMEACDSSFIGGQWYFSSTTLRDTLFGGTSNGCDSIVVTNLTINNSQTSSQNIENCDSALVNGSWYFTTQTIIDTLTTSTGCDSIVTTDLIINTGSTVTIDTTIANGQEITIGNSVFDSTGSYAEVLVDANGCDSVINLNLTVEPLGIQEGILESIEIYPNPATKAVFLKAPQNIISKLTIYEVTGRLLGEYSGNTRTIDVSNLPSGMYVVKVETNMGVVNKRFTRQ